MAARNTQFKVTYSLSHVLIYSNYLIAMAQSIGYKFGRGLRRLKPP